ncbi:hypothetical protein VY88_25275 [Azospirillum thiophilum]|uniref:Cytochrome c domain-containing protein n=2 Tax=Azospirillum thiophilum TaxID=528244 RepID=A0AAC8ZWB0_9PROT|nr:c-type cytochrome [Azospirillum thiophilum]ALG75368.1 hypothetical protein AL072_31285 [Azospirillum thiophilum]KJR62283.1 hypothetical protein VY88_25275 [Azospirillum thiophilum]
MRGPERRQDRMPDRPAMRRAPTLLLATLLAAGLPLALGAAAAGPRTPDGSASAVDGRSLALALCGDCHIVAPGRTTGPDGLSGPDPAGPDPAGSDLAGPDLVERMQDPAMTELALRSYLRTSHPLMPNIRLTRGETDDIVAYLLTLKEDQP